MWRVFLWTGDNLSICDHTMTTWVFLGVSVVVCFRTHLQLALSVVVTEGEKMCKWKSRHNIFGMKKIFKTAMKMCTTATELGFGQLGFEFRFLDGLILSRNPL